MPPDRNSLDYILLGWRWFWADERIWTPDLSLTKGMLYQLSYIGVGLYNNKLDLEYFSILLLTKGVVFVGLGLWGANSFFEISSGYYKLLHHIMV